MKFCKLLIYDLKNGIAKKWYLYVSVFVIACVFTGNFCSQYNSCKDYIAEPLTSTNILFYLYQGKEPFSPEWGSAFVIPVVWILMFLLSPFLTLDYPMKSLSGHGIQVITRIGTRTHWWGAKCVWIAESTLLYFGIWYLTVLGVCLVAGADISFGYSQAVNAALLELEMEPITHTQEVLLLVVLPITTALSLNFLQLCMGLFVDKIYAFFSVSFLLLASAYFKNPAAIGNFAMVKRSVYCTDGGLSPQLGLAINGLVLVACIVIGFWRIQKFDILKNNG
jgi:hypothetical protein